MYVCMYAHIYTRIHTCTHVNTKDGLTFLDALTGKPQEDDVLSFALPVCAPMSALLTYKYRVKMIPGTTKKGKAGNNALYMFMNSKAVNVREKELMQCIKDNELQIGIPGKVKVMGPAGVSNKKK
eukprot:m.85228 g.85228  ORF g.85228 m.85228 type:complete len:125 (-) comp25849_c1_seq1:239-613(-)